MIHIFKTIFIAVISVLAFSAVATAAPQFSACAREKNFTTSVKFNLETPSPTFDFTKTRKQMNAGQREAHEAWLKQNAMQTVWQADEMETLGTAAGGWGMMHQFRAMAKPYDRYGSSWCPYFGVIEINMIYRTIINIPKEFPKGSCGFNLLMAHEMRHHKTNVEVAQQVAARLRQDMPTIVAEVERSGTYVSRAQVDSRFKFMEESLKGALNVYIQQVMSSEMAKRNRLIDSPAEYERSSLEMRKCGD